MTSESRASRGLAPGPDAPTPTDEVMCDNCPFAARGPGLRLARSLRPGRMAEVRQAVLAGYPFYCHKTTVDDGFDDEADYSPRGRERVCGGSLAWLRKQIGE